MKTKITIVFFFFILSSLMNPFQLPGDDSTDSTEVLLNPHPFYDSQVLDGALVKGKIENTKILTVLKTLAKYTKDNELKKLINAQTKLSKEFVESVTPKLDEFKNPFLENYITALEDALIDYIQSLQDQSTREEVDKKFAPEEATEVTAAAKSGTTGLFSPTMLVDALATFIAERFKAELATTFLEKLKTKLEAVKDSGWGILFPATTTFLTNAEIYNFKVFLTSLKDVFREDLNTMDLNLIEYLKKKRDQLENPESGTGDTNLKKGKAKKIELPKDKKLLNFSILILELVHDVRTGAHPAEIINTLNQSEYIELIEEKLQQPIRLLSMVSRVMVNKEGDGWVKPAEFKILLNDGAGELRSLFVGLIYALEKDEMDKIVFNGKPLKQILAESEEKIKEISEYVHRITVIAAEIEAQVKKLKDKEDIGFDEYNAYLDIVHKLVELGFDVAEFAFDDDKDKIAEYEAEVDKYMGYAKNILDITKNIHEKDYTIALVNTMNLLQAILPEDSKTLKEVLKYGTFMISMINAKTAGDMEKVLEAAAMPVGGYRVVRSSPFSVSLSTYPGFFGSRETLSTDEAILGKKAEWNAGFAAPIGIAFGLGRGTYDKPGPSWTFFLPVIDIGAAVSWRLGGEDEGIPDISWKNIFAPGLFIIYGVKNSPFSLGLGAQYGPQLREIKGPDEAVIESSAFRVGILIAIEIPIFNFYAKGK